MTPEIFKEKEPNVYALHTELRKDAQRFLSVGKHWNQLDDATFRAIKNYFALHLKWLHLHHDAEESYFFPTYAKKSPEIATAIAKLQTQHEELLTKMHALENVFAKNERGELAELFVDYADFVEYHLSNEETTYLGIFDVYTQEEIHAIGQGFQKVASMRDLLPMLPWMLDGMDEELREKFFTHVPFFVPLVYRILNPGFKKQVQVFERFAI